MYVIVVCEKIEWINVVCKKIEWTESNFNFGKYHYIFIYKIINNHGTFALQSLRLLKKSRFSLIFNYPIFNQCILTKRECTSVKNLSYDASFITVQFACAWKKGMLASEQK